MDLLKMEKKTNVKIIDIDLLRRRNENRKYLLSLNNDNLLISYLLEAGLYKSSDLPKHIHGGWESPTCELRGHFLGHWLSACAMTYETTEDQLLKAKAEEVIEKLEQCQLMNGGRWAASIPEKYLYWIADGKQIWAPQYTIHKTFMGLLDMYELANCEKALQIAEHFAEWFYDWSGKYNKEEFQAILDVETGGMLEIWAILYRLTNKKMYKTLIERYWRETLFSGLLQNVDVLTNMHANTTIPEILGVAAVYDITREDKYLQIVKAYWKQSVTDRGYFATGGQTCGEIWTAKFHLHTRLGDKNQEHCTVYNMMRLASFLFCHTKNSEYMDYWERNLYNGIMSQGYWRGSFSHGKKTKHPKKGILSYFLPMRAGERKPWSSETKDFFCCHGSLVQANAAHNNGIYYKGKDSIYICQYFDSDYNGNINDIDIFIRQRQNLLSGSRHMSSDSTGKQIITPVTSKYPGNPRKLVLNFDIQMKKPYSFNIYIRIPRWSSKIITVKVNNEDVKYEHVNGFIQLSRKWKNDCIHVELEKSIYTEKLPGSEMTFAFLDGPVVLAGLSKQEKTLFANEESFEKIIVADNEREWGIWTNTYKTIDQNENIRLKPLYQIGYEKYQIYFPIKPINKHK